MLSGYGVSVLQDKKRWSVGTVAEGHGRTELYPLQLVNVVHGWYMNFAIIRKTVSGVLGRLLEQGRLWLRCAGEVAKGR